jgi:hypothetical protein
VNVGAKNCQQSESLSVSSYFGIFWHIHQPIEQFMFSGWN